MNKDFKKRFTVISNEDMINKEKKREVDKNNPYQTNPLTEKLVKFVNTPPSKKFSVEDLIKW